MGSFSIWHWLIFAALAYFFLRFFRKKTSTTQPSSDELAPAPTGRQFHSKVVGVSYQNPDGTKRQNIISSRCRVGMPLELRPEPANPHDADALAVWTSAGQIGYIESGRLAIDLARNMATGATVTVTIAGITGGSAGKPTRGVNILVQIST